MGACESTTLGIVAEIAGIINRNLCDDIVPLRTAENKWSVHESVSWPPWEGIRSGMQTIRNVETSQEPTEGLDFLSVPFVNSQQVWISASDGSLFHTTDGGATWRVLVS